MKESIVQINENSSLHDEINVYLKIEQEDVGKILFSRQLFTPREDDCDCNCGQDNEYKIFMEWKPNEWKPNVKYLQPKVRRDFGMITEKEYEKLLTEKHEQKIKSELEHLKAVVKTHYKGLFKEFFK